MDKLGRQWLNVELEPQEAQEFKAFLRGAGIKHETSQAGNLIHFECLMDYADKAFAEAFLNSEW